MCKHKGVYVLFILLMRRISRVFSLLFSLQIQSSWRRKTAICNRNKARINYLAACEIERIYRGRISRKKTAIKRMWSNAAPGTERIRLGLNLIEKSKDEFERHREEIDALRHAQEKGEVKLTQIQEDLKASEKELFHLEQELKEIDSTEVERNDIQRDEYTEQSVLDDDVFKNPENNLDLKLMELNCNKYNHITQSHSNHIENKKKRIHLQNELSFVFSEIKEKQKSLQNIEIAISDMEAARQRKDREFARLQRDLMSLLNDQKDELHDLRKKGLEVETAAILSAEAASATAKKAKEAEKQTTSMFHKQEDLLKFQFMSMGMTYFSSLNMLKEMRQMNSDTAASAIASSAKTAAAAAATMETAILKPVSSEKIPSEPKSDVSTPLSTNDLPTSCHNWSIENVSSWLTSLALGMYVEVRPIFSTPRVLPGYSPKLLMI